MPWILVFTWLSAAPQELSPAQADVIAAEFAAALAADDLAAFAHLAAGPLLGPEWAGLAHVIEAIDDPVIAEARVLDPGETTGGSRWLTTEVVGSAVAEGNRRPLSLPRRWSLELRMTGGEWRIASAQPWERRLAATAPPEGSDALDALLVDHPELDRERFLMELVDVAAERGQEAEPAVLWARQTSRRLGLSNAECASLEVLAYLALVRGDAAVALALADENLALAERNGSSSAVLGAVFSRGVALWFNDRIDEAVATFLRAGDLAPLADNPGQSLRALYMASYLEERQGRLRPALAIARQHEALLDRYPSPRGRYDAAILRADLHAQLGNLEVARRHYETAATGARQMRDTTLEAVALANLAAIAEGEELRRAVRTLATVVASAEVSAQGFVGPVAAGVYRLLGDGQVATGDTAAAEGSLQRSLALAMAVDERAIVSLAEQRLADLRVRQGRAAEALEHALGAASAARARDGNSRVEVAPLWSALDVQGKALRALGRHAEAERAWREAIDHLEAWQSARQLDETGRVELYASTQAPYRQLVEMMVSQGRTREAVTLAERMRARGLREILENGRVDFAAGLTEEQKAREAELERTLIELNRSLLTAASREAGGLEEQRREARLALHQFRAELGLVHPSLGRLREGLGAADSDRWPGPPSASDRILMLVVHQASTLELLLAPTATGEFTVTVHRVEVGAEALAARIDGLARRLESRDPGFREPASDLYQMLIAPFEAELSGATSLAVLPDGALWRLPFHVLADGAGVPLVERMAVFRSPSLFALRRRAGVPSSGDTLLAMGDPAVSGVTSAHVRASERGPSLGPLPEARREVQALARLYGKGSRALVGEGAREQTLKRGAGDADVIHLATHGLLDDEAPLYSALLLAAGEDDGEDGLLEVREIAALPLRARLVVLSACESARGRVHPGEGVMGMSWALLAAGTPAAVLSDWKVDSASTEVLMVRLHREMLGGRSPAEAMRRAQLAVRALPGRAHPYYWAAFGVLGAGW